ncbi:MAG: HEAT repeat domain-containing protein [Anaerolineae bacterium]|nr:HEAT repeat domain-containing protein [Anaerolineae bacterium]
MPLFGFLKRPDVEMMKSQQDIGGLIKAMTNWDGEVREAAMLALIEIGEPAVEPLIVALKDKKSGRIAARLRGVLRDPRAIQPLTESLNVDWFASCAWALTRFGSLAVEPLIDSLKYADVSDFIVAAKALGAIGDARAVEPLAAAYEGGTATQQYVIAEALLLLGDPRASDLMKQAIARFSDDDIFRALFVKPVDADRLRKELQEAYPSPTLLLWFWPMPEGK